MTSILDIPEWIELRKDSLFVMTLYRGLEIKVHRHISYPNQWLMSCTGILSGIDLVVFKSLQPTKAKQEAIKILRHSLMNIMDRLPIT